MVTFAKEDATMNGFAETPRPRVAEDDRRDITPVSMLSPVEIDVLVRRARAVRAAFVYDWARRTFHAWASLLPGRKSLLPRGASRWQTLPH